MEPAIPFALQRASFSDQNCQQCSIAEAVVLHGPLPTSFATLGTIADYRRNASRCPVCALFLNMITTVVTEEDPSVTLQDNYTIDITYSELIGGWYITPHVPRLPGGLPVPFHGASLAFARCLTREQYEATEGSEVAAHKAHGEGHLRILVQDSVVDWDEIRGWLSHCCKHHRGTCFGVNHDSWECIDRPDNLFLIDVILECITEQPGSVDYLALSYVWGSDRDPLIAITDNMDALAEPRSLATSSPLGKQLAPTIRDAMLVTARLGFRYLWVDRLCIVQDDEEHKRQQIQNMAAIYSNCSLAILAASGDGASGLPGINTSSPSRNGRWPLKTLVLPNNTILTPHSTHSEAITESKYYTRGWTLQEEILAPRALRFHNTGVIWNCRRSNFSETHPREWQVYGSGDTSRAIRRQFPDPLCYASLLSNFSRRVLTYEGDAVRAFSGITTCQARCLSGGILYGIPEILFEAFLLWMPAQPLVRRCDSESSRLHPAAPSWSPLAWTGGSLDSSLWEVLFELILESESQNPPSMSFTSTIGIMSCVEFYKIERLSTDGRQKTRIASSYNADVPNEGTPVAGANVKGWFRLEIPLPLTPLPRSHNDWLPYLYFQTKRCYIPASTVLGSPQKTPRQSNACCDIGLVDDNNAVIGALRLNTTSTNHSEIPKPGSRLELIVLSKGICSESFLIGNSTIPELEYFHSDCVDRCHTRLKPCRADKAVVPYGFYNVMWIGWDRDGGGVAYRKGVGRIRADVWDRQETERVDVVLG
ncbi:heterokaryon incompatibility protein-domain-containing protein [Echria macrotheca]|uniref:Heterokaryon incompatibility protein-domain-containing protein n=1 Tax=Echria macrotheca TaxID=438768 RepID=A0AAJ0B2G2_9PEZI|nr:heterokaryon incompatibility protein-domain-containing protein [Echria macrotheca]